MPSQQTLTFLINILRFKHMDRFAEKAPALSKGKREHILWLCDYLRFNLDVIAKNPSHFKDLFLTAGKDSEQHQMWEAATRGSPSALKLYKTLEEIKKSLTKAEAIPLEERPAQPLPSKETQNLPTTSPVEAWLSQFAQFFRRHF